MLIWLVTLSGLCCYFHHFLWSTSISWVLLHHLRHCVRSHWLPHSGHRASWIWYPNIPASALQIPLYRTASIWANILQRLWNDSTVCVYPLWSCERSLEPQSEPVGRFLLSLAWILLSVRHLFNWRVLHPFSTVFLQWGQLSPLLCQWSNSLWAKKRVQVTYHQL